MADLVHSVQIAVASESVYPPVAAGAGSAEWWAADVSEENGAVVLGFFNRATIYRLRMGDREPARRAERLCESGAEWAGTRLIFSLEPRAAGPVLRFTHADWRSETDYFVSCNTTGGALMMRLKAAAEGKSPGPLFLKDSMGY